MSILSAETKTLTFAVAVTICAMSGAPAWGQVQTATGPYRTEEIREACRLSMSNHAALEDKEAGKMLAEFEGICSGAISTVFRMAPQMNQTFRFCPPPEASLKEIMPLVIDYIDKNPKTLSLDIRDVANYVGRLSWPCK